VKPTKREIEQAAIGFRDRMRFLEDMWGARVEYDVDIATGLCSFKVTPPGSSVTLVVHDARAWNVTLPAS
jgi:hypothetical protein